MIFFTFSTTQEYYSMPIYPALALLLASAISGQKCIRFGANFLLTIFSILCAILLTLLILVRNLPANGELASALAQHPEMYTLSLGHMGDLTLNAFAYLRLPLALAAIACAIAACGALFARCNVPATVATVALAMVVFFQAARIALIRFDPYLGSYPLALKLISAPPGTLIEADAYYNFSSVFFYANRNALLLNGRINNLEYGSYAPNAPQVFIGDAQFANLWNSADRCYLLASDDDLPHINSLVGGNRIHLVAASSGKSLLSNLPLTPPR